MTLASAEYVEGAQIFVLGIAAGGALFAWRGWLGIAIGACSAAVAVALRLYWPNR